MCEEEDEEGSEGEDIGPLKARPGGPYPHDDEEIERQKNRDLPLARSLHLRAEGLVKLITKTCLHLLVDDHELDRVLVASMQLVLIQAQQTLHPLLDATAPSFQL